MGGPRCSHRGRGRRDPARGRAAHGARCDDLVHASLVGPGPSSTAPRSAARFLAAPDPGRAASKPALCCVVSRISQASAVARARSACGEEWSTDLAISIRRYSLRNDPPLASASSLPRAAVHHAAGAAGVCSAAAQLVILLSPESTFRTVGLESDQVRRDRCQG